MSHSTGRFGAGENLRRFSIAALVVPAMLVVAACGTASVGTGAPVPGATASGASASSSASIDTASTSASASPSASVAASPTADDPCSLVTPAEAEAIVGEPVVPQRIESGAGPTCAFLPTTDTPRGFVNVTIRSGDVADDVEAAINELGYGEIPGVGDAAAGAPSTMVVKTGETVFALVATDSTFQLVAVEELVPLAQTIVERLGGSGASPAASPSGSPGSGSPSPSAS